MRSVQGRTARIILAVSVPVSMIVAAGIVWQGSYAAFEAETHNSGNQWSSGRLTLTDDDAGSARFTVTGMTPGQTETKCLRVTASADVPGVVKLYTRNPRHSGVNLEDHVVLTVEQGSGGSFTSCDGFVADSTLLSDQTLESAMTSIVSYGSAVGSWNVAGTGSETATYRFTWTFDTHALDQSQIDALQGNSTGVDFEWEMQSG